MMGLVAAVIVAALAVVLVALVVGARRLDRDLEQQIVGDGPFGHPDLPRLRRTPQAPREPDPTGA